MRLLGARSSGVLDPAFVHDEDSKAVNSTTRYHLVVHRTGDSVADEVETRKVERERRAALHVRLHGAKGHAPLRQVKARSATEEAASHAKKVEAIRLGDLRKYRKFYTRPEASAVRPIVDTPVTRLAVCLCGELRILDLTVHALTTRFLLHLAKQAHRVDVFISSFFTKDSAKVILLSDAIDELNAKHAGNKSIATVRLISYRFPTQWPPGFHDKEILRNLPLSLTGKSGILGLFNVTTSCVTVIARHEAVMNARYDMIVKTRPDAYYHREPEAIPIRSSVIPRNCVVTPYEYHYNGANDRFLSGPRDIMMKLLDRLEFTRQGVGKNARNSESHLLLSFKSVPDLCVFMCPGTEDPHVCDMPFCILRQVGWSNGVLQDRETGSTVDQGGKCRVCEDGLACDDKVDTFEEFEAMVGADLARGHRQYERIMDFPTCVERLGTVKRKLLDWDTDLSVDEVCFAAAGTGTGLTATHFSPRVQRSIESWIDYYHRIPPHQQLEGNVASAVSKFYPPFLATNMTAMYEEKYKKFPRPKFRK